MRSVKISIQEDFFMLTLVLYLIFMPKSFAEIFQWEDEEGRIYFGDTPPESKTKNKKIIQEQQPAGLVTGSAQDSERRQEQATSWYKKRLKQSRMEDKKLEKMKAQRAKKNKIKKQKCERYKKRLNDFQQQLRARKRAGIKPRHENRMLITIDQYQRDVDFYC